VVNTVSSVFVVVVVVVATMDMIFDAMNLAIRCHDGQRRKGLDQPYVMHPVRACQFLTRHGVTDPTILSATLLHDAKEDCNEGPIRTWELICHYVNGKVASIVDEVSDDRSGALTQVERKRAQVAHAPELSFAATLVKVADMYDNLKSLTGDRQLPPGWGVDRVRGYAAWKRMVYDNGKFGMRLCEMGYQSMYDDMEELFEHFLNPVGGVSHAAEYVEQVYYPLLLASASLSSASLPPQPPTGE